MPAVDYVEIYKALSDKYKKELDKRISAALSGRALQKYEDMRKKWVNNLELSRKEFNELVPKKNGKWRK